MADTEKYDIVEVDTMTGNERILPMSRGLSREGADREIKWRLQNITARYTYRLVPAT